MRIPRFYTTQALAIDTHITLEQEPSHHLRHVLRLRTGDDVILFAGDGNEYTATLTQVAKHGAEARIGEPLRHEPKPTLFIHLMIGLSRGERMDFALQKATELGVAQITPIISKRCVVKLVEKKRANRMDHWHKIVINACEQSGRCRLPLINNPMAIDRALKEQKSELALLLDHRNAQTLAQIKQPRSSVSILIGPEGGLSQEERDLAIQNGFQGLRLGPRIMRTETAPLATIAAIQTIWGDF
jgi:16S rRNA (uracil1498-N3)-methyltransferase